MNRVYTLAPISIKSTAKFLIFLLPISEVKARTEAIILNVHFFHKTVLIALCSMSLVECVQYVVLHITIFQILFKSIVSQNSRMLLNFRVTRQVRYKASLQAVCDPRSQIDFRKYNIMRVLHKNDGERSSPSASTYHAGSTSRLQMCASVEHKYRTSLVHEIEFLLERIM